MYKGRYYDSGKYIWEIVDPVKLLKEKRLRHIKEVQKINRQLRKLKQKR